MKESVLCREFYRIEYGETSLQGVLSTPNKPESEWKKTAMIFVPYGLNPRFGPHQIYIKIERELCRNDFPVVRFDAFGCGDSSGDFTELSGLHRDDVYWRLVSNGKFIDDVLAVIDHVVNILHPEQIVLGGICGGAVRSLLVADQSKVVRGVIPIAFPSTIDDVSLDSVDKMNVKAAEFFFYTYLKKIFSPRAWGRLILFKSDYKRILKSTKLMIKKRCSKNNSSDARGLHKKVVTDGRKINFQLIESIRNFLKNNNKILVIYGENDRYLGDYEGIIEDGYLAEDNRMNELNYKKVVISDSNHEFSFSEWQKELTRSICNWMDANFQ